ncbi:MAG: hypothetical protein DWQ07_08765 [Chloroflexi bacterium]|nr:MAG: hypothetical protein DWQ07_08765 [Chloroflexota bacterium]MBL1193197.1 hypothetical protein [Chloroflexota bacterium]NOH10491.1 hypothetical protein [Chloroflexota bacterium]
MIKKYLPAIIGWLILLVLSFLLAWVSNQFQDLSGWLSFHVVLLLSTGLLYFGWWLLRKEQAPNWLGYLLIAAAVLRLALGVFWFLALPVWGYTDNEVQQAGYVMEDAYNRDANAWRLGQSGEGLWEAFAGFSSTDQYGGLLFISAFVYRYLGGTIHQPLLTIVVAASFSSLAVLFGWAFAWNVWDDKVATLAAWGIALYPEALLLGSSQMREAFTVTLVVAALYGLTRLHKARSLQNYLWLGIPFLLMLPISAPNAAMLIAMLVLAYLALSKWSIFHSRFKWVAALGVLALAISALALILQFDLLSAARTQAYVSENASGWVYRSLVLLPEWAHFPFLITYGIFRPLLPSALIASGLPLWKVVGITRALGWMAVLVLLLYASFLALRGKGQRGLAGALLLVSWGTILVASFRGGGDLWDNPRYRVTFAGVQVALAAWAWYKQREIADPWLRRAFGAAIAMVFWFVIWYLRRYVGLEWGLVEIQDVVGLGLATAALYWIWDWATFGVTSEDSANPHAA